MALSESSVIEIIHKNVRDFFLRHVFLKKTSNRSSKCPVTGTIIFNDHVRSMVNFLDENVFFTPKISKELRRTQSITISIVHLVCQFLNPLICYYHNRKNSLIFFVRPTTERFLEHKFASLMI